MAGYSDGTYTPPSGAEDAVPKDIIRSVVWNSIFTSISAALTNVGEGVSIEFLMRDSPFPVLSGVKGYAEAPMAFTIDGWKILGDTAGSVVFDIWKVPFASFPPNSGNSITGSAPPTLSSSQSSSSSTLTGWTTSVSKGDILAVSVTSSSGLQQVTLSLVCGRN